ncbi:MAG: hypothetical protein ACTHK8_14855, partial [Ginsengibacter sp.]
MSVDNIDRTEPAAKFLLKMVGLDARPFIKSNVEVTSPLLRSCFNEVTIFYKFKAILSGKMMLNC